MIRLKILIPGEWFGRCVDCMCVYVWMYVCMCVRIYVYVGIQDKVEDFNASGMIWQVC
jgi:hypothetical protein